MRRKKELKEPAEKDFLDIDAFADAEDIEEAFVEDLEEETEAVEEETEENAEEESENAEKKESKDVESEKPDEIEEVVVNEQDGSDDDDGDTLDDDDVNFIEYDEEEKEVVEKPSNPKTMKKSKSSGKKVLKGFGITIGILAGIYLIIAGVFTQISFYDTTINGEELSFKTEKAIDEHFASNVDAYELTIHTSDGKTESIKGQDIGLDYNEGSGMKDLFMEQQPLLWPMMFFETTEHKVKLSVTYDEVLFDEKLNSCGFMDSETFTEPVNAYVGVIDGQMGVLPEVYGTKLDVEKAKTVVADYIDRQERELNLKDESCYIPPELLSTSEELAAKAAAMNPYLAGTITYEEGEAIDAETIASWLVVNENNEVSINQEAVETYVADVADRRNTIWTTRTFTTPTGKQTSVSGGNYGWLVDQEAEVEQIVADITAQQPVTRSYTYSSHAHSYTGPDWGTTYVLVDLSQQHMWYIQEGNVIFESDVVTGKESSGDATPQGVYKIDYKQKNAVLRAPLREDGTREYETPVDYWIHVYDGIGFHDATWQSSFGGTRYLTNGSHGCINMPLSKAGEFYPLVSSGVPVVFAY